jgi:16S rRNA (guanine527-N7)-methyltransferase
LPELDASFGDILDAGLEMTGVELTVAQREAIEAHVRLLLAWNEHINLSGLRSADDIARGHVLDALIAVPALRALTSRGRGHDAAGVSLLDMGSGGGFPGLPLAIALRARRAALVDSIAKKAAFLEAAAAVVTDALYDGAQPTDIVAFAERVEDLADKPDQREAWDLVVARAVGTIAEVAELGLPLARRYGSVVAWKRAADDASRAALETEIANARRIVQATGGAGTRVIELDGASAVGLPGNCLVAIRKVRPTPERYPRSPGERRRGTLP